jgi:heme oxygenase
LLIELLRSATGEAHRKLESELALLEPPLDRGRFVRTLARFHGYHTAWEPLVVRLIGDDAFPAERRRLALLSADLDDLGVAPSPPAPTPALASAAEAWGSLYVMEGSTLGGKVIAKALKDADWAPPEGLRYFDPYGRRTADMWRAFLDRLAAAGAREPVEEIVRGAVATFAELTAWLAPAPALACAGGIDG